MKILLALLLVMLLALGAILLISLLVTAFDWFYSFKAFLAKRLKPESHARRT